MLNLHGSKVSFGKKDSLLILAITFGRKHFFPNSGLVEKPFTEYVSKLETQRSMNVDASPEVLLKENKDRSFLLSFERFFIDKLSFFCLKLLPWVPNINNVLKVYFVENVEVTVVLVKHVEFLGLLFGHFFLVKVQEEQGTFDIVVHVSTLFLPDAFLLAFSLLLFLAPFLLLVFPQDLMLLIFIYRHFSL